MWWGGVDFGLGDVRNRWVFKGPVTLATRPFVPP